MNHRFHTKATSPELAQAALFYGMYSHIARKLGVSPQHVRQVSLGISTSKKVEAAIKREIKRRMASVQRLAA